jgi:hypothetical protein
MSIVPLLLLLLSLLSLLQGQRDAEELVRSTRIHCDAMRIKADETYQTKVLSAEANLAAVSGAMQ